MWQKAINFLRGLAPTTRPISEVKPAKVTPPPAPTTVAVLEVKPPKATSTPATPVVKNPVSKSIGEIVGKSVNSYIDRALKQIGVKEVVGPQHNQTVVDYFADAGFAGIKDDETPWCAAFVGAMLKEAGFKASGSLAARSYEKWGQKLDAPAYGAIGVKKRLIKGKDLGNGHVFFIVAADSKYVYALGGNQSNAVSVVPILKSKVIAYRLPTEIDAATLPVLPKTFSLTSKHGSES